MNHNNSTIYLGLDISKSKLDLAGPNIKHQSFDNTPEGITKLIELLQFISTISIHCFRANRRL